MHQSRPKIVLDSVLRVLQPLVRLLIRSGVTYPAFATALKRVFLEAARAELASQGMAQTDSAMTLLSGVHRRDVRNLSRQAQAREEPSHEPLSQAAQVIARWLGNPAWQDSRGQPRRLARPEFDTLATEVSRDVRPRAMLDELLRLGVVQEDDAGILPVGEGFAPRQGFQETAWLFADNLRDHAQAAAMNLAGTRNFLEQAVFVDEISEASANRLHEVAVQAWKQAFRSVMGEAQQRFDADRAQDPGLRGHRARFGVYFFSEPEKPQ